MSTMMARGLSVGLAAALALGGAALTACGSQQGQRPDATVDLGTVTGRVYVAGTETAVAGASVRLGSRETTANEQGWFSFDGVTPAERVTLTVRAEGYADAIVPLTVRAGALASADVPVVRAGAAQTIDLGAEATVTTSDGLTVRFPAGAFVTPGGAAATGSATVTVAYLDPSAEAMLAAFPGGFTGRRADGTMTDFESFGLASIVVRQGASTLALASGARATITIPVATAQASRAPATVPLWSLDETLSLWTEEGSAQRQTVGGRDVYIAEVPHLSWWNVDLPMQTTCVRGCVRDPRSLAVSNVMVTADGVDYSGSSSAWTGADGCFAINVKVGSQFRLYARQAGRQSVSRTITAPTTPMRVESGASACEDVGTLSMSQVLAQVTLTWGESPRDLDSHMTGPGASSRFHVYYGSRGTLDAAPYCDLDTDDTTSHGPEVTTLSNLLDGRYRFSVHNFTGQSTSPIEGSGAKVMLALPRVGAVYHFSVPTAGAGERSVWRVFDLVVSNGQPSVESIDTFGTPAEGYDP